MKKDNFIFFDFYVLFMVCKKISIGAGCAVIRDKKILLTKRVLDKNSFPGF